jgi:hypothetical protein
VFTFPLTKAENIGKPSHFKPQKTRVKASKQGYNMIMRDDRKRRICPRPITPEQREKLFSKLRSLSSDLYESDLYTEARELSDLIKELEMFL